MRYTGVLLMTKLLKEYIETKEFELGTAGYVKEDGSFIIMDEYHGEDRDLISYRYPEFSNTHPEEDTCIRLWREPNDIQYEVLEYIIDRYLDREEYCKLEINNDFYKVFSLREGACEDYQWDEQIGNWTGYKLVQMSKNYFNNKLKLQEDINDGCYITESPYEASEYILESRRPLRIVFYEDDEMNIYAIGDAHEIIHVELFDKLTENGYNVNRDDFIGLIYEPHINQDIIDNHVYDGWEKDLVYSDDFSLLFSTSKDIEKTKLFRYLDFKKYDYSLNEKLEKTESGFFITENVYEAKDKILSYKDEGVRIFIDESIPVYFIGTMYDTTHLDMIDEAEKYGYDNDYDAYDEHQICLLYDPSCGNNFSFEDDAISDNYFTRYCYPDFEIWSELDKDFTKFQLSKVLGKLEGILDYTPDLEESKKLNEELLLELNRGQLINKSKKSDPYKDQSKGRNRWERRNRSRIATRVDQYNKIDMNDFFKKDELRVGINVNGETSDYVVLIRYNGALREIAEQIKRNNNKLEFKCVLIALQRVFNSGNVFVSCTCPDWKYRQAYHSTRDGYNSGVPEMIASDITNPGDTKGAGCKHVNLVLGNVDWLMKVASVINNYIHYMEKTYERKYADLIFPKLFGIPYEKAVQLNLFDTDDTLKDDEEEISLSNRYGRERTKFKSDVQINNMKNFKGDEPEIKEDENEPKLDLNMTRKEEEIKDELNKGDE